MAELILTEEEKKALNHLDWSDESLGKLTRKISYFLNDTYGGEGVQISAAVFVLADKTYSLGGSSQYVIGSYSDEGGDPKSIVITIDIGPPGSHEKEDQQTVSRSLFCRSVWIPFVAGILFGSSVMYLLTQ